MLVSLPTKRISAISLGKTFIRVLPTRWRRSQLALKLRHCHPMCSTNVNPALARGATRRKARSYSVYRQPAGIGESIARTTDVRDFVHSPFFVENS